MPAGMLENPDEVGIFFALRRSKPDDVDPDDVGICIAWSEFSQITITVVNDDIHKSHSHNNLVKNHKTYPELTNQGIRHEMCIIDFSRSH